MRMEKIKRQTKVVEEIYLVCDNCNTICDETHFEIHQHIGKFRDDPSSLITYHLCSYKCLNNFIITHKEGNVAHSELIKNE
jgi:hypothetical protein